MQLSKKSLDIVPLSSWQIRKIFKEGLKIVLISHENNFITLKMATMFRYGIVMK